MRVFRVVCLLFALTLILALPAHRRNRQIKETIAPQVTSGLPAAGASSALHHQAKKTQVDEAYGRLPLSFEANYGRVDDEVKFLSRGSGYQLLLTSSAAVLQLQSRSANAEAVALSMKLAGANPAPRVFGRELLPGKSNYLIGNDPAKWRTDVPHYAKVEYEDVYPGVNLVYYGNQQQLEYDFIVAPGADPRAIKLTFEGAERVEIDAEGDLVLRAGGGQVVMRRPFIYQDVDGTRREIEGGYRLVGKNEAAFHLDAYDRDKPLVIDPILNYSTYFGGGSDENAHRIAVDSLGNAYVTGYTTSANLPASGGPIGPVTTSSVNVFVVKFDPAQSGAASRIYSTLLAAAATTRVGGSRSMLRATLISPDTPTRPTFPY
jgi:hypothetical protein